MEDNLPDNRARLAAGTALAVAALIAIAAIFGLGPFADDDLSVAEYLAQGDEICTQAHDEFLDLQNGTPRTAADAAELIGALIEVAEEERDAIADLPAPASLVDPVAKYLDARVSGIDGLRAGLDAAKDEDAEAYERIQVELQASQGRRYEIAREVGFKECSKPIERPASSGA